MTAHTPERSVAAAQGTRPDAVATLWPPVSIILAHVAATYGISVPHLQSKRRDLYTVEAKRVAIHLLAQSGQGLSAIGRLMCLDHSTVHHHLHHVVLDQWQQQLVADLHTELHCMAARVRATSSRPAPTGSLSPQERSSV